jgi:hypothetical protein
MKALKLPAPLQYAGGYALHLYCDRIYQCSGGEHLDDYLAETFTSCVKQAKSDGWRIHRKTRTATCPNCVKEDME